MSLRGAKRRSEERSDEATSCGKSHESSEHPDTGDRFGPSPNHRGHRSTQCRPPPASAHLPPWIEWPKIELRRLAKR